MLVDTHAHLDFEQFAGEEDAAVARAVDAGVSRIINVGTTMERSRQSVALAERYDAVWAAVGVHPHDADEVTKDSVAELVELAAHPRVVAIGEIGFDQHYTKGPSLDAQQEAFGQQVDVAARAGLPIIVHSRDTEKRSAAALSEAVATLKRPFPGVVHCFTGSQQFADQVLELGYLISFTAPIGYPKNDALREVVKAVPLDRIMVETDCPFLAPQDKRGQRNEPSYVVSTARKIAELKDVSFDQVAAETTRNAERLFGLQ